MGIDGSDIIQAKQEKDKQPKKKASIPERLFSIVKWTVYGLAGYLVIGSLYLWYMDSVTPPTQMATAESSAAVVADTTGINQNHTGWLPAGGNIWKGVKLYSGYGHDKIYVGQVIDWSETYTVPYTGEKIRAIQILMHDGSTEWKDRAYIIKNTFVKKGDPALK